MKLFLNRALAFVYDIIIQLIVLLAVVLGVNSLYLELWQTQAIIWGLCILLWLFLHTILPLKLKGTLGKFLADLQVVPTNGHLTFGRWLFREIILKYLYPYAGIVALLSLYPRFGGKVFIAFQVYVGIWIVIQILCIIMKGKPLHDYLMRTNVVAKTKEKKPEVENTSKSLL